MKEQNKTPGKELNKMKTNNLPGAGFKTLVISMLSELRGRVGELSENFTKEIGNIKTKIDIKKNQSELKTTLTETKTTLQRINSGKDEAENQINNLEHKEGKSIQSEQQEKRTKKK